MQNRKQLKLNDMRQHAKGYAFLDIVYTKKYCFQKSFSVSMKMEWESQLLSFLDFIYSDVKVYVESRGNSNIPLLDETCIRPTRNMWLHLFLNSKEKARKVFLIMQEAG